MTTHQVTRSTADAVLAVLTTMFPHLDFFLADHDHEGLPEGSWSIAAEGWGGDTPWTYDASAAQHGDSTPYPSGVFLEPMNHWCLAIYPAPVEGDGQRVHRALQRGIDQYYGR